MPDETAHGRQGSQRCNLYEGPLGLSRMRLLGLEIHVDQSLGTGIMLSDGHKASEPDSFKDRMHLQSGKQKWKTK